MNRAGGSGSSEYESTEYGTYKSEVRASPVTYSPTHLLTYSPTHLRPAPDGSFTFHAPTMNDFPLHDLPVAGILRDVVEASQGGAVVVTAPPGSGKTMLVPAAVLDDLP